MPNFGALKCSECDAITTDVCPDCGQKPLCATCRSLVGECADCAGLDDDDDDEDTGGMFDSYKDEDEDEDEDDDTDDEDED